MGISLHSPHSEESMFSARKIKMLSILITRLQTYCFDIERTLLKAIETGIILWIVDIKKPLMCFEKV